MGFLRFFLAVMVLISHMGIVVLGINPGVSAVIVFYLLAGYVVCQLWLKQGKLAFGRKLAWFYRDRFWRIAPLYYFALAVATVVWAMEPGSYFLSAQPGATDWLFNLTVVPLNYYMFNQADRFTLIPPAWSLAVELQFYFLMPFLLWRHALLMLCALASVAIFALAQTAALDSDIYGYRLLPGIGFIFVTGALLRFEGLRYRAVVLGVWLAAVVYLCVLIMIAPVLRAPYNVEVALGLSLGLPLVYGLSNLRLPPGLHRLQGHFGLLSYGVFLLHFPVIWLLSIYSKPLSESVWTVLAGSVILAVIGHYAVERPLWRRFRQIVVTSVDGAGGAGAQAQRRGRPATEWFTAAVQDPQR